MPDTDDTFFQRVESSIQFLSKELDCIPQTCLILGTGIGEIIQQFKDLQIISYNHIPGFLSTTAPGHRGELIIGSLEDKKIAVLNGRLHYYEGYSARETTLPLRAMSLCGVKNVIATNAAGGLNQRFTAGDLMVITDHIYLINDNPLRGVQPDHWGSRFPDLSRLYTKELTDLAHKAAAQAGIAPLRTGTYACVPGPSLETPAETRYLKMIGADAVGMSTIPELLVAAQAEMRVLAISILANINDPDNFKPILLDEVIASVRKSEGGLSRLLVKILSEL